LQQAVHAAAPTHEPTHEPTAAIGAEMRAPICARLVFLPLCAVVIHAVVRCGRQRVRVSRGGKHGPCSRVGRAFSSFLPSAIPEHTPMAVKGNKSVLLRGKSRG
jgi:hypothetical protein